MTTVQTLNSGEPFKRARPLTFALLFAGESLLRALNVSVIPLQARQLLGDSQKVSLVATLVSASVLITTLCMPLLLRNVRRRWTYTLGAGLIMTAAILFGSYTIPGQILGQFLRNTGAAVLNVTLSLYIMDHIRKEDLTHSEPLRLAVSTVSWVIGPATGTWLFAAYGSWGAQSVVLAAGIALLTGFWIARIYDPTALVAGTLVTPNPFANAWTFFRQPRLRLAWTIAFARSCFWSGVFIYGPLMIVEGGLGVTEAGYVISASQLMLPLSLLYGRIARHAGVRPVVAVCFAAVALLSLLTGLLGSTHITLAIACLLLASFCATGLDGVGGVPFLRAVKPRQRRAMTSVYRTFYESSELLPGVVYSLALLYFDVSFVFVLLSILCFALSVLSWHYLPKSL